MTEDPRLVSGDGGATHMAPKSVYFLTNLMNLNGILGSRLVAPRESFGKYYTDLLSQCPGSVPLLVKPPSAAHVAAVTAERGSGAPVIIEFPANAVDADPRGGVAYASAVPMAAASVIHFPDARALREHRARSYANLHPHDELLALTPELFGSGPDAAVHQVAVARTDWRRLDRIRGAVGAAVAAVEHADLATLAMACLGGPLPAASLVPSWLSWDALNDHAWTTPATATGADSAEHLLFKAIYAVLGETDTAEAWRPSAILEAILESVGSFEDAPEDSVLMARNLQRVRELIDVERGFQPFRETGGGLVCAKALTILLLRPDLDQLLRWPRCETGADDLTRLVAAIFAGRLRGIAREALVRRSLVLDDATAGWAARIAAGDDHGPVGAAELVRDAQSTSLVLDGVALWAGET